MQDLLHEMPAPVAPLSGNSEGALADTTTDSSDESSRALDADLLGLEAPATADAPPSPYVDPLDAEWAELLSEPLPPLPPPLVSQPPPTPVCDSSVDRLAPVVESDEDEPPSAQVVVADPVEVFPPEIPLRLTCNALFEIDDETTEATPSDADTPRVPDLVATTEARVTPLPVPSDPIPISPPNCRIRRRGGPPMAVLMERMSVGDSVATV